MQQLQQADAASQVVVSGTSGVNEKELCDYFETYGSVLSVHLVYDCAGKCQGFCFIQFKHASSARHASLLGLQHKIAGRFVTVQPVHQRLQGTQTRQTQAQHTASISRTARISLLDVLCQVPTLPQLLDADSQKALSATCKSCRLEFIAQVQVVTTERTEDYVLACERRWPQLHMVIREYTANFCHLPHSSDFTRIINLHLGSVWNRASIYMLRPLHNLATDLPCPRVAAQQLAHQLRTRWPMMTWFTASQLHDQGGLGLEIVSQLVSGTWRHLTILTLCDCDLKAEAFLLLSQGNWPGLDILDVSGNCLDAEGVALLAKGNWPVLTCIDLSFDPAMDAVAIAHLSATNWSIGKLTIKDTRFSVDMAAELADLQLPKLRMLYLKNAGLTAEAVSELARADWPSLYYLYLSHDDVDDLNAVCVLLGLDLEEVQALIQNSSACNTVEMDRTGSCADLGLWPTLTWIKISNLSVQLIFRRSRHLLE